MLTTTLLPQEEAAKCCSWWRLLNPSGLPANCFLTECGGLSAIFVRIGEEMTHYERCSTSDDAFHRAHEILALMVELG